MKGRHVAEICFDAVMKFPSFSSSEGWRRRRAGLLRARKLRVEPAEAWETGDDVPIEEVRRGNEARAEDALLEEWVL